MQQTYYAQKIEENKDNLKGTRKVLKQAVGQGTKSTNIDKVIYKGSEYTESKEIADICTKHFVSVGRRLAQVIPDMGHQLPMSKLLVKRFAFCKVTKSQVERVIKTLIKSKATGIYNIPNKILKDSYQVIALFFQKYSIAQFLLMYFLMI